MVTGFYDSTRCVPCQAKPGAFRFIFRWSASSLLMLLRARASMAANSWSLGLVIKLPLSANDCKIASMSKRIGIQKEWQKWS